MLAKGKGSELVLTGTNDLRNTRNMIGILLSAGILCGIMHIVAKDEADYSFVRVLLVAAVLFAGNLLLGAGLGLLSIPIMFVVTAWALQQFCYLGWGKAFLVATLYYVCQILLGILITAVFQ